VFRTDIEGLRGLAILLVVLYHAGLPGLHGGFVGVDVFFVLSGYLITGLLVAEVAKTGRVDFVHFYGRRMRRLLPAAAVVLLITLLAASFVYSPLEQIGVTRSAQAAALYFSNISFAMDSMDYHAADSALHPLLHTWSLAVEEQYYMFWPLLVALVLGQWRRESTRKDPQGGSGAADRLVPVIAVLSLGSLAVCVWQTSTSQPWAFFGLPARGWEFGVGALAAVRGRRSALLPAGFASALGIGGLLAVLAAGFVYTAATPFPGFTALLPVLGTAALLVAGEEDSSSVLQRGLRSGAMQWFGRLSYSWYLWHWPILVLAAAAAGPLNTGERLVGVVVALGLSVLTYAAVEVPVRHGRWFTPRPVQSVAAGVALTLAVVGGAQAAYYGAVQFTTRLPRQRQFAAARTDLPLVQQVGCQVEIDEVWEQHPCVFGDTASATTVVLFGDSHAGQWFPAIERVVRERGWKLVVFVKAACPVVSLEVYNPWLRRPYRECSEWREKAIARIVATRPALILVSNWADYVRQRTGPDQRDGAPPPPTPAEWSAAMRRTLVAFENSRIPTALIRDTPQPNFDVPVCLSRAAWQFWRDESCTFDRTAGLLTEVAAAEAEAVANLRYVKLVDLTPYICAGDPCPVTRDGMIIYRDEDHLSTQYSAFLAPALAGSLPHLERY